MDLVEIKDEKPTWARRVRVRPSGVMRGVVKVTLVEGRWWGWKTLEYLLAHVEDIEERGIEWYAEELTERVDRKRDMPKRINAVVGDWEIQND